MTEGKGEAPKHVPVMVGPVIEALNIRPDGCYMDGTFGRGGHSAAILRQLGSKGRLVAIDRDPQAVAAADDELRSDPRVEVVKGEIADIREIALARELLGQVDGLLLDLGVSSPQLDQAERGFSFGKDGPLDMRMDPTSGTSAAEWLAHVDEKELKQVLSRYGEERFAGRIARAIVARREQAPIRRTRELADVVAAAVPHGPRRTHPATKTFQAIRIRVNEELEQLDAALAASIDVLRPGGRLCVISFHSLEDRRVKEAFRAWSKGCTCPPDLPVCVCGRKPMFRQVTTRAVVAGEAEVAENPRARSAKLRVVERLP